MTQNSRYIDNINLLLRSSASHSVHGQRLEGPSQHHHTEPVEDLHEGDETEAEEETKHSAKGGDEVYRGHLQASLIFCKQSCALTVTQSNDYLPIAVAFPK